MPFLRLLRRLAGHVRFFADPRLCRPGTWVVLPTGSVVLRCGIAALVEVAGGELLPDDGPESEALFRSLMESGLRTDDAPGLLDRLTAWARSLKRSARFPRLVEDASERERVGAVATELGAFADAEDARLRAEAGGLAESDIETFSSRILRVRDIAWHVEREALSQVAEVRDLAGGAAPDRKLELELRRLAAVLRSIDRIEIRGRDSAGVAVQVSFAGDDGAHAAFLARLRADGLDGELERRGRLHDLPECAVSVAAPSDGRRGVVTFVYKVAAEVGRLGDNVSALRDQIRVDALLRVALAQPAARVVVLGHTRWASSGVINVPNCHPVDNGTHEDAQAEGPGEASGGRIFVVMNGDVDNHLELREVYETASGRCVSPRITTDTKVVALEIERQIAAGHDVADAFRRACARFEGSCAIGMVTDLAPGRLFLSLRGSGQSLYVGVSQEGFFASSEVYGVVEEARTYLKLDGETEQVPGDPATRGQVVVVSDEGPTGGDGLVRLAFDGERMPVTAEDLREAEITTRDVDRGDFEHFFRKEITQASRSVERTLRGRVAPAGDGDGLRLSESVLAPALRELFASGVVRRIYVVGQGTAAVAGAGIATFLARALGDAPCLVEALPATEMSGFHLRDDMSDTVVIAVTQSGSTADTNRAIDLARRRGAHVVAVVNRRNSDVTYRADGVVYTSDGRDVEMSVASTKAFYSQIVAGALLSLGIARALGTLGDDALRSELATLVRLPALMQEVLDDEGPIREAATRFFPTREHWAVVGSGHNRVAAQELRIKLSELCYKSIAVDVVEDKKHIDLSSEPLILVLAAGNPEAVLNDVVKDVAIFAAHEAVPIVFAARGERRFDPYAAAVIELPEASPLGSMILCALAGHLLGYHAARAIDENARFLGGVRAQLVDSLEDPQHRESLPEQLRAARRGYLDRLEQERFTSSLHPVTAVKLAMLFDRVTGLAVGAPEDDAVLGSNGGAGLLPAFVNTLGNALDQTARPIDAIKHQAKIVTVGTSRPEEELGGVLGEALAAAGIAQRSLAPVDQLVLRRLLPAVTAIDGTTRYVVEGLRPDGLPGPATTIRVADRQGVAASLRSRVESGGPLAGTKRQVVMERRLFTGVGRGDGRRIAILPVLGSDREVTGLVLLHVRFADTLSRDAKARLLGPKLDRLRDLLAEADRVFEPSLLDGLSPEQLVLEDADDLADLIL